VSCRTDVERALDVVSTMPPLRGVFHSAGALDDGAISQQTWERFQRVLAAKVDGARHLDELTCDVTLDHFVLYSSIASVLGSAGQANHAVANAFLDALAQQRAAQGRPALSIDWGAWSEVGAAADRGVDKQAALRGVGVIAPGEGLATLDRLMARSAPQVGVLPAQWPVLLQRYGAAVPPYFAELDIAVRSPESTAVPAARSDVLRQLDEAPAHRRPAIVLELVREQAAHVLALPAGQIAERTPLSELGLDSLMAVELRNLLGATLGIVRPLPATLVFDYPTVAAIADYIAGEVLATGGETASDPDEMPADPVPTVSDGALLSSLLDDLTNLSDDEIDRQLAERARK
jgi:acyl carrier protein